MENENPDHTMDRQESTSSMAPGSHHQQQGRPQLGYHRGGLPEPGPSSKPANFVINLGSSNQTLTRLELDKLVKKLPKKPQSCSLCDSDGYAARLCYEQWSETVEVMEHLWRTRVGEEHLMTPWLIQNVEVSSDKLELEDRLKPIFMQKVREFMDGELVKKSRKKLKEVTEEINVVSAQLRKPNPLGVADDLLKKKEALMAERDLVSRRTKEFRYGIRCVKFFLKRECPEPMDDDDGSGESTSVFKLEGDFNWDQIHHIMKRECKRLEDSLPIFSFRQEILRTILGHQVITCLSRLILCLLHCPYLVAFYFFNNDLYTILAIY